MDLVLRFWCSFACFAIASAVATSCTSNQFPCDDGKCIDKFKWCDSVEDCDDDSDETYCRKSWWEITDPNKCKNHHFKCNDGICIPKVGLCDGMPSCPDGSDEANCEFSTAEETSISHFTTHWETEQDVNNATYETPKFSGSNSTSIPSNIELSDEEDGRQTLSSARPAITSTQKSTKQSSPKVSATVFHQLDLKSLQQPKSKALTWLLSKRDENFGWGEDTPRALAAISMSNSFENVNNTEDMIMAKQLHLQLSVALMKNSTTPLPICELALFINALLATCSNPRNFHGLNLVTILRQRVNLEQQTGHYISPLVYLTLCLSNETTYNDLKKLQDMMSSQAHLMDRIDNQALITLASSCIVKMPNYSNSNLRYLASRRLLQKVSNKVLPENIYEVSLLTQAFNEVRMNELLWNRKQAIKIILQNQDENGSFGDILATYFVLPVLAGKSLISLSSHCKTNGLTHEDTPKDLHGETTYIQYSLYFGSPVEMSQTIMLKVSKGTNFLRIMQLAQDANPLFKFEIDYSQKIPIVYTLGGMTNDVERGMFWTLYISKRDNTTNLTKPVLFLEDIRKFVPKSGEENIFWFKPLE